MKRIKIFTIALAATGLSLASCGNDFLSVLPTSGVIAGKFYDTEEDMLQALTAAYAPLQWEPFADTYGPSFFLYDIMGGDVLIGGANAQDNAYMHMLRDFSITPLQLPWGLWSHWYSGINRSNLVINNLPNATQVGEEAAKRFEAEALFLRTYYYYNLWFCWGNVPYFEVNLDMPYRAPQMPADELYETLVTTITDVIDGGGLPEAVPAEEYGRVTRAAAQMLKARLVMYKKDEARYPEVLADMEDIITKGHYSLKTTTTHAYYTPFEALWTDEGEWCSESIFEINFIDGAVARGWGNVRGVGGTVFPRFIGINALSGNDEFQQGWGFAPVPEATYNMYDATDTRRDGGIINFEKWATDYSDRTGGDKPTYEGRYQNTGYFLKKYMGRVGYNATTSGDADMNFRNNTRVFRYAETLLIAAELNSPNAQAYLDMVRDRAYDVDNGGVAPAMTATVDNIIAERRKEFFGEGLRYFDIVRTGQAATLLGPRGWTQDKMYWPIPDGDMSSTADGSLVQNPYNN